MVRRPVRSDERAERDEPRRARGRRPAPTLAGRLRRAMAGFVLTMLGVVLLGVASQPLWLAPLVRQGLAGPERREVRIESVTLGLTMALEPVLRFRNLYIANAPWADRARPLLRADEAVAVASWRSLWAERRIVSLLVLRNAEVDLERLADGTRNWRLRDPQDRGPGRYRILALRAERSSLRLVHGGVELELLAAAAPNGENVRNAAGTSLPVAYRFSGRWRGIPFTAGADAGDELTFYETARTFPLRGWLDAGAARLEVDGRAGDILREQIVDLAGKASGTSLAPFAALLGPRSDDKRGFQLEGRIRVGGHRFHLDDVKGRFGTSDVRGSGGWRRQDNDRHAFDADLASERVDAADLAWLLGRRETDWSQRPGPAPAAPPAAQVAASAVAGAAAQSASTSPGDSAPLRALRSADAQLRYRAAHLHLQQWPPLHSLALEASLEGGKLTVAALDAGIAGGHLTGTASLDAATAATAAAAAADLAWQGLHLEQIWPAQKEKSRIDGALGGKASLRARGATLHALRESVDGRLELSLGSGHIASLLDAEMGLEGGKIMKSLIGGSEPVPLRCAHLALRAQRGQASIDRLLIESERTRITGRGRIDLGDETLDVLLTPQPLQGGLFNLPRAIHLAGPWARPSKSLAPRGADGTGDRCST